MRSPLSKGENLKLYLNDLKFEHAIKISWTRVDPEGIMLGLFTELGPNFTTRRCFFAPGVVFEVSKYHSMLMDNKGTASSISRRFSFDTNITLAFVTNREPEIPFFFDNDVNFSTFNASEMTSSPLRKSGCIPSEFVFGLCKTPKTN